MSATPSLFDALRMWIAQRLWPKGQDPSAQFYRFVRDMWIGNLNEATNDEERLDAAENALDTLYSYFLVHGLIEEDAHV